MVPPLSAPLKGCHHLKQNYEPEQKGLKKRESLSLVIMATFATQLLQHYVTCRV